MKAIYYFLLGMVLAGADVMIINNFDGVFLSLSFIALLLLMRPLRRNKNGIVFLFPILAINYLYAGIEVSYFLVIFYLMVLFIVKDEWTLSSMSEFKLGSSMLMIPYVLLIIFRFHFWPNIVASSALSFLLYGFSFLRLKHDKKRILPK